MNKKSFQYYPLMLLLLVLPLMVKGQEKNTLPKAEKLALFTDRGIYITGGVVHFTAFVINHTKPGFSNILYAEIIESDGTKITGGKFPLTHSSAHGCLTIPTRSITGNYYLRVYTKYMRNLGPKAFAYVGLKIVNPHQSDVLEGKDTLKISSRNNFEKMGSDLKISTDRQTYYPSEKATVDIKTNSVKPEKIMGLSISVIPEAAAPEAMFNMDSATRQVDFIRFYPENRGLSLSGVLRDSVTKKPEVGTRVNLSIIGNRKAFLVVKTDRNGHFYFSLPPYSGNRDIFINPQNIPGKHPKILVDNDFSSAQIQLPSLRFKLDSAEQKVAIRMAQDNQLKQIFYKSNPLCNKKDTWSGKAFYGKPSYVLKFGQYIQLPTLEAYLYNLPSKVKVKERHGKKYFKVLGDQPVMNYLDPLVLVDYVAVDNPQKILTTNPANMDRVEVITKPYVIGDMEYGGIVNIISKKGDFAGIDLPSSGMFLNYAFLHNNCQCSITGPESENQPDTRTTLYWNPDVSMNSKHEIHFSFNTSGTPGKYIIVLQGVNSNGKPFMKQKVIEVRPKP